MSIKNPFYQNALYLAKIIQINKNQWPPRNTNVSLKNKKMSIILTNI